MRPMRKSTLLLANEGHAFGYTLVDRLVDETFEGSRLARINKYGRSTGRTELFNADVRTVARKL